MGLCPYTGLGHGIVSLQWTGAWDCVLTLGWGMELCPYTGLGHGIVSTLAWGVELCPHWAGAWNCVHTGLGRGIVSLHWTALGWMGAVHRLCSTAGLHTMMTSSFDSSLVQMVGR